MNHCVSLNLTISVTVIVILCISTNTFSHELCACCTAHSHYPGCWYHLAMNRLVGVVLRMLEWFYEHIRKGNKVDVEIESNRAANGNWWLPRPPMG